MTVEELLLAVQMSPWYWGVLVFFAAYPIVTSIMWIITALIFRWRWEDATPPPPPWPSEEATTQHGSPPGRHWPFVSLLVPAHDEEVVIARSVAAMLAIDYPAFEVIVIDDGSTDGTLAALDYTRQAHALRPDDPKAQSNLAFAELVNGDAAGALRRAQEILTRHPGNVQAGSALIQAKARLDNSGDPFLLVPDQIKGSAEVMCAAVVLLRQRDDLSWRELAARALAAHPTVDHLKRFAAEAELEPILSNPEIQIGSPVPSGATATVVRCANTLKELWEKEIGSEDVCADELVPLAGNLASALRFSGEMTAAADVLDRSIGKAGPDHVLVRARALIHLQADEDTKAVELLGRASNDPEIRLMSAQIQATKAPPGSLFPFDYVANDQSFSVSRYRKGDLDFVAMYGEVEADTSSIPRLERRLGPTWPIKDESELREIIAEYEAWVRSTPGVKSDPTCAPPKHDPAIRNQTYLAAFTFATPDHRHGVFQLDIAEHMRHYTDPGRDTYFSATAILKVGNGISCLIKG